ncbi:hypothetical protein Daus18300_007287 [Diaporthe australafricana]|uniref:BTB domain-containing protein n=1 Tax=Diaporthe australafricana TaxID=127596 RepID=A0ABR3WNB8_9PEZI
MATKNSSDDTMSINVHMQDLEVSESVSSSDSTFAGRMVTVVVGPKKVKFVAHEQVICQYSTILRDMFAEKPDAELFTFPHYEPQVFKLFMEWAYIAKLGSPDIEYILDRDCVPSSDLVKLYGFAQEFCVMTLLNSTVSVIYTRFQDDRENWHTLGPDTGVLQFLVDHVDSDAHLYTVVTRAMAYRMLPVAVVKQEDWVQAYDGGWGGTWDLRPQVAPQQPTVGAGWGLPEEGADTDAILDALPGSLLRSIFKEFFYMKNQGWSGASGFKACVGSHSDFHVSQPGWVCHCGKSDH